MSKAIENAEEMILNEEYNEALKIAKKRHGRDDIESYLTILDMLIEKDYLPAIEEKGLYYQYYDPNHDDGDYGEKYFDKYLEAQPLSINAMCDKALCRYKKNDIDESMYLMNKAYKNYDVYSKTEKPRISKKEVKMGKIEILIGSKDYSEALKELNNYENQYGPDSKLDLYKGCMLQKNGQNEEALHYLDNSINEERTLMAINAKGDAYFDLKDYKKAFKQYKFCINSEKNAGDDLELITNFNYKAAYCQIGMGNNNEGVKYLNKTIEMLNEHGRLPKDIEAIYQKCSFEKDRLMRLDDVKDVEYKESKFRKSKFAIISLIIILILYFILKMMGY